MFSKCVLGIKFLFVVLKFEGVIVRKIMPMHLFFTPLFVLKRHK